MTEITTIKHDIQKYILSKLINQKYARFRDMRPPRVDTNLYSYHLKLLQKNGLVAKADDGYTLTLDGMVYAGRLSAEAETGLGVAVMVIIQDGFGGTLMARQSTQPFIDQWTLPTGVVCAGDRSIKDAADRVVVEQIGNIGLALSHAGDSYIRLCRDDEVLLPRLVHVFYGTSDADIGNDKLSWIAPHKIVGLDLVPGVEQVITRAFFRDPYFFEEYDIDV